MMMMMMIVSAVNVTAAIVFLLEQGDKGGREGEKERSTHIDL